MRVSRRPGWIGLVAGVAAVCAAALVGTPASAAAHLSAATGASPMTSNSTGTDGVASAIAQALAKGVVVDDITIHVRYGHDIPAYVVRPAGKLAPGSQAGILFLHWLGQIHSDRTEYLDEAVSLATQGVVSVLPQGTFPWAQAPSGKWWDYQFVQKQANEFDAALNKLASMPAVDQSRIALVGHDYGAMYGALVADQDARVSVMVLETPDARWGDWFAKYWLDLHGQARHDYMEQFVQLDPVKHTSRLGSHVLFQWAGQDIYVTPKVQAAYAASSPDAQVILYPDADHQLDDQAMADRDAFLAAQLGLGG